MPVPDTPNPYAPPREPPKERVGPEPLRLLGWFLFLEGAFTIALGVRDPGYLRLAWLTALPVAGWWLFLGLCLWQQKRDWAAVVVGFFVLRVAWRAIHLVAMARRHPLTLSDYQPLVFDFALLLLPAAVLCSERLGPRFYKPACALLALLQLSHVVKFLAAS